MFSYYLSYPYDECFFPQEPFFLPLPSYYFNAAKSVFSISIVYPSLFFIVFFSLNVSKK